MENLAGHREDAREICRQIRWFRAVYEEWKDARDDPYHHEKEFLLDTLRLEIHELIRNYNLKYNQEITVRLEQ